MLLDVDVLNLYMLNVDVNYVDYMYNIEDDYGRRRRLCIQLLVKICVSICIVVESYVHVFMTDGGRF